MFVPKSRKWLIRPFLAWSDRTNVGNPSNLVRIVRNHSRGHMSHHHVPRNTPPLVPLQAVWLIQLRLYTRTETERWRERNQYFLSSSGSNRWVSWQAWQSKRSFQNVSSGQNYSAWRKSVERELLSTKIRPWTPTSHFVVAARQLNRAAIGQVLDT